MLLQGIVSPSALLSCTTSELSAAKPIPKKRCWMTRPESLIYSTGGLLVSAVESGQPLRYRGHTLAEYSDVNKFKAFVLYLLIDLVSLIL